MPRLGIARNVWAALSCLLSSFASGCHAQPTSFMPFPLRVLVPCGEQALFSWQIAPSAGAVELSRKCADHSSLCCPRRAPLERKRCYWGFLGKAVRGAMPSLITTTRQHGSDKSNNDKSTYPPRFPLAKRSHSACQVLGYHFLPDGV